MTWWPEVLELPHFVEQHRMAQMQVRRRGIEARLDAQGATELEPGLELITLQDLVRTAGDQRYGVVEWGSSRARLFSDEWHPPEWDGVREIR
jgi:hypothetical protein